MEGSSGSSWWAPSNSALAFRCRLPMPRSCPALGNTAPAGSRRRIWFQVVTPLQAKDIVYSRRQLAGTGVVIHDHLTTAEYATFKALQPKWREAKEAKKRVFWRRSALFVDGVEVKALVAA